MPYISNTKSDQEEMLKLNGVRSIDELIDIPSELRLKRPLNIPDSVSESELRKEMLRLSETNGDLDHYISFLGAGAYDHYIPAVVPQMISRSEFYTSYTPYQAEASQGTLQAIYEYQTMICRITGMDVANASMYDGASALAEAALMAARITKRNKVIISRSINPNYRAVVKTYLSGLEIPVVEIPVHNGAADLEILKKEMDGGSACFMIQHPNFFGCLEEVTDIAEIVHRIGALLVVMVDPISLGILKPPGEMGADIVLGEGQGMGIPVAFGGPYLGIFATKREFLRQMPGRIVGATIDDKGRRGFCLTLQAREQHIKRERATSNICTNENLAALAALVYLAVMGKNGLSEVGKLCISNTAYARSMISGIRGFSPLFDRPFFKEIAVRTPSSPSRLLNKLLDRKIIGGLDLSGLYPELGNVMLISVTEKRTREDIDCLVSAIKEAIWT